MVWNLRVALMATSVWVPGGVVERRRKGVSTRGSRGRHSSKRCGTPSENHTNDPGLGRFLCSRAWVALVCARGYLREVIGAPAGQQPPHTASGDDQGQERQQRAPPHEWEWDYVYVTGKT